jgi:uncharacterized protein with FMN-binding domain
MPRAIVALIVTIAAVVLIASFRTTTTRVTLAPPSASAPPPAPAATPSPSPSRGAARLPRRRMRARTITGAPVQQPYGTVQVSVTINAGRITDVRTVAIPLDSGRSQAINSEAAPLLRSEALRVQSARIDVVSGATYTSDAYAQSLQSALDRARG